MPTDSMAASVQAEYVASPVSIRPVASSTRPQQCREGTGTSTTVQQGHTMGLAYVIRVLCG